MNKITFFLSLLVGIGIVVCSRMCRDVVALVACDSQAILHTLMPPSAALCRKRLRAVLAFDALHTVHSLMRYPRLSVLEYQWALVAFVQSHATRDVHGRSRAAPFCHTGNISCVDFRVFFRCHCKQAFDEYSLSHANCPSSVCTGICRSSCNLCANLAGQNLHEILCETAIC